MRQLIAEGVRVDAIVTDPPYHLTQVSRRGSHRSNDPQTPFGRHRIGDKGFMGKQWDGGGVAFDSATWELAYELLKPGGHLLAFGGTRTYHRMVCAIEDAGFEIRDCIFWVYGSGFPKSLDVSKAIDKAAGVEREVIGAKYSGCGNKRGTGFRHDGDVDGLPVTEPATDAARQWEGWGTALKPAVEPIVVARKPLDGTVAENVQAHGTGALNVDACRVAIDPDVDDPRLGGKGTWSSDKMAKNVYEGGYAGERVGSSPLGRWPANLVHDCSDEVVALFPHEAGAAAPVFKRNADKFRTAYGAFKGDVDEQGSTFRGDAGSAARFFYCSKTTQAERAASKHPTVKPLDLMRWLVRLVVPRGAIVMDPFAGSGSTVEACMLEQMQYIAIEREAEYVADIQARIDRVQGPLGLELSA